MKKRKVLHIVESFGSGVFSFLTDLVNSTDDEFEITIAYGVRNETLENFKEYFSNRVRFIEVKNFTRNISLTKDMKAFFEVKKIIKEVNPDVIHLHSSKAGFIGRFAANGRKVKMLYNPHGFSFFMKNSSSIKRMIYLVLEKIGALRNCTIVGCSNGEYTEALKLTKNSIYINNGINIESLEKVIKNFKEKEIDLNNLKICTSGRIGYQKNPELFNKIAQEFPNIQFTWIGDGELKETLTSKNIQVTGWKTREEVLKIINENDVFLLLSLWEGLSLSLLEAMYLKKVCIANSCIGNKDVIKNGENGFLVQNDNCKEIIENLNKEICKKVSENAKADILNEFNTKRMVEEYKKEYRS